MELELDGLTKCYRDKKAVDGFSYRLREGIYGLLGPNGLGKNHPDPDTGGRIAAHLRIHPAGRQV